MCACVCEHEPVCVCVCTCVCACASWNPPIPLVGVSMGITTLEMSESQMADATVVQVSFESLPFNPFSRGGVFYMDLG